MVSGDRQVTIGERGPFHSMQREFSRHFERIDVLCPRPPGPVRVRTIHDNVHFHPAECSRWGMVGYIARRGRELIAAHGHGLIVSHDYGWFYNGRGSARLARATGVPYLSELHHVPGHPIAADLGERVEYALARAYVGWAGSRAAAFRVVNGGEMPALLARWGVSPERVLVLPSLYIDLDVFRPAEELAAEQDLCVVGRLVGNKGLDRLLDALALCEERGRRLTALVVGKGPLEAALRSRAERLGLSSRVRFVRWVDSPADLASLYRASRVAVCASTCEGGPRVTVEAMACGTPVVSTPVGMMGELLADGEAGLLCGFDVESLADALLAVLDDEERRLAMGERAARIAERFEYSRAVGVYAEGIKALAGGDGS
ncbi:MAG: glycosyltransferase [Planctomycetota bacterium]|nr:glycosyltransferase [Planctomycetota bacterium]MDP6761435.1 glycosyltransferase [Planctomycetota bacterium]MDP6990913.1 glycosyltransferase [Planctomycetota bacterium]